MPEPSAIDRTPTILHEAPTWLVVDKPAGWHCVETARSDGAPTIAAWLRSSRPDLAGLVESGLVHRLDRETSGCLLVARDEPSRTRLREAFSGRGRADLRKVYLALVEPSIAAHGTFTLHFASRHRRSTKVIVSTTGDESSRGDCRWRVVRAARGDRPREPSPVASPDRFDLVEIEIVGPGRRHQIRAGFAHLGHPLAGDVLYRGRPMHDGAGSPVGVALHAAELGVDGARITAPRPRWTTAPQHGGATRTTSG